MKPKLFLTNLIIVFASFIVMSSCTKNVDSGAGGGRGSSDSTSIQELVADHWVQQGAAFYVDPFLGILQGHGSFNVYAETSNGEMLLSSVPTTFMSGEIWITISSTNLILNYKNFKDGSLPFASVNMRIVFAN